MIGLSLNKRLLWVGSGRWRPLVELTLTVTNPSFGMATHRSTERQLSKGV